MKQAPAICARAICLLIGAALCTACGGGDATGADTGQGGLVSSDDSSVDPRQLEVSETSTDRKTIVQCICDSLYRNTVQIYHFRDQNAVLMVEFDNTTTEFASSGVMHLFDQSASLDAVSKWINNQHSDGLFIDPASPLHSITLDAADITVTAAAYVAKLSGYAGDEYDKYHVEFSVANQITTGLYFLNGFSDNTNIYLQTRAQDI